MQMLQILVMGEFFVFLTPQMGIFDPPNMQLLVMGDPQMTFEGIWSKHFFFYNLGIFDPPNRHF